MPYPPRTVSLIKSNSEFLPLGKHGVSSVVLRNMSSLDLKTDILQFEMFRKYLCKKLNSIQPFLSKLLKQTVPG